MQTVKWVIRASWGKVSTEINQVGISLESIAQYVKWAFPALAPLTVRPTEKMCVRKCTSAAMFVIVNNPIRGENHFNYYFTAVHCNTNSKRDDMMNSRFPRTQAVFVGRGNSSQSNFSSQ